MYKKETGRKEKIWLNEKLIEKMVYQVNIEDLYLYPENTRLAIFSKKRNFKFEDVKNPEVQRELRNIIEEEYEEENKITENSLRNDKLKEPIFIDSDGIVLSGNRRTTLLKKIYEEDIENGITDSEFKFIDVIIEEEQLDEIQKKTYELMLQYEPQQKVDYSRLSKMVSVSETYPKLREKGLDDSEISKRLGYKRKDIMLKDISEFEILEEYIRFYNKDIKDEKNAKQIWEFDKSKYLNMIDTINRLIKNKDEYLIKKIKNSMFSLMALDTSQALDIRAVFNNAYSSNEPNKITFDLEKIIEEKVNEKFLFNLKNNLINEEEIRYIRNNVKQSISFVSNVVKMGRTEMQKIDLITEFLEKISIQISQIDENSLTDNAILKLKNNKNELKKIIKKIDVISKK